jgi:nickel transport system substrate-binding protein
VWLFTLRNDVQFSNGEPFNAQAAVANFQAVLANRQRHAWLELPIRLPTCGRSAIRSCRSR